MDRTMQMWAEQRERDLAEYEQAMREQYEQAMREQYEQAMREQYEQAMREQYEQAMREQYEADMRHGEQEDTPTTAAPLRQLFADLGIPADDAVELRADELAAVLDTAPPALTREQAEAKLKKRKGAGVDRPGPRVPPRRLPARRRAR